MLNVRGLGHRARPAAAGGQRVELVELVTVVVGADDDRLAVGRDRDAADGVVLEGRQLARQPPETGSSQRLNCPEMFVENSTRSPSGVNATAGW